MKRETRVTGLQPIKKQRSYSKITTLNSTPELSNGQVMLGLFIFLLVRKYHIATYVSAFSFPNADVNDGHNEVR